MQIQVLSSAAEIGAAAGKILCDYIAKKPDAVFGFATGASPVPTYQYMAEQYRAGKVSFAGMRTFNLDEYCNLPKSDKNSYFTFMQDNLFSHIDVKAENIKFLNGNAEDVAAECERYEMLIKSLDGIDIQILGIGRNGHIGFNEPAAEFSKKTFQVALTQSTIEANQGYFDNPQDMPRHALTMGIDSIMQAKEIVFIATGAAKAAAVQAMVEGPVTPQSPASVLQQHGNVHVFLDAQAAALLTQK